MVSYVTILLFFIYTWGLGFTVTSFVKKPENFLERFFLNIGIGLGVFAILSILLNFFHISLDWKIFLVLSIIFPLYKLVKNPRLPKFNFKVTKSTLSMLVVLLLFFGVFYMYAGGAFKYPYLENEDPWGHAIGMKYVALEKNAYDPELIDQPVDKVLSYIDPYPPAYDVLIGVLHQTSDNLNWTMKFFNALIISLGYIFFYLFAQLFLRNRNKALFATFVLAAIPSYLSHFIWAHGMVVTLFFPTMYAFEKIKEDKKWMYLAAIMVAAIWVTQNLSQPIKLSTMIMLYLIVVSVTYRKFFTRGFVAFFGGVALSLTWWGVMIKKYTFQGFLNYYTGGVAAVATRGYEDTIRQTGVSFLSKIPSLIRKITGAGGSGARVYNFDDFFIAKSQNMINNPIGIGIAITLLVFLGVIYVLWKHKSSLVEKQNTWIAVTLFWLIFTFWGVMGIAFPISVAKGTFRVWMLLAIPVSLIAAEGLQSLLKNRNKFYLWGAIFIVLFYMYKLNYSFPYKNTYLIISLVLIIGVTIINNFIKSGNTAKKFFGVLTILFIVIGGITLTSGVQKYELNNAVWITAGAFQGNLQEAFAYGQWFETIPPNTNVFLYAPRDKLTIGFGMNTCAWCQNVIDFREEILDKDVNELYAFLKENEYEYFVVNGRMDARYFNGRFGENETQTLLPQRYNEIINAPDLFTPIHQIENSLVAFKIN